MIEERFANAIRINYTFLSLLVLFYHAGASNPRFFLNVEVFRNLFNSLRMPLYFFIGGILIERQIRRGKTIDFLKNRFRRLIVPFLWFAPFYYLVETTFSETIFRRPTSILFSILFPGYHLWFLPAFFFASLVGAIQAKYITSNLGSVIFVLSLVLLNSKIDETGDGLFAIYASIRMLPFLALGIFYSLALYSNTKKINRSLYVSWVMLNVFLGWIEFLNFNILFLFLVLPLLFLVAGFVKVDSRFKILSKYTFQIYLFSPLGIGFSRYIIGLYGEVGVNQEVIINSLCGLIGSFVMIRIFTKIKKLSFMAGL